MKNSGRLIILCVALAAILIIVTDRGSLRALRLSDGRAIGLDPMVEEVKQARLIFVGEQHDRKETHNAQLEIIKRLHRGGVPLAIGMEMFTAESQPELDRWVAGKLAQHDFIRFYYREWHEPWPLYRDIFLYARANRLPLIGLNVPRKLSRKVAREGFAALTPLERQQLPAGISCSADPAYRKFIQKAYAAHLHQEKSFDYFCEAQMLWNKAMGKHLEEFVGRNPGRTVVVLAGVGHAMKRGIPLELFQSSGYSYKVILPELPELDRSNVTSEDADYLILFDGLSRNRASRVPWPIDPKADSLVLKMPIKGGLFEQIYAPGK